MRPTKAPPHSPESPPHNSCHPRPPAGALRNRIPSSRCICPLRISAPLEATPLRACAGPEPGSNMPHGARSVCRARRIGDANGNAAQTGGLARQVRQRMNRLGKPEHRARFCFFSKKKSLAGMRRFPIPSEIQIRMDFKRSATSLAALKLFLISPTCGRCLRHRAPQAAAFARSASARPLEPTPLRACAGPEPGSSMPHGVRRACRAAA